MNLCFISVMAIDKYILLRIHTSMYVVCIGVIDVGFRWHRSIDGKVHNIPDISPDENSSHGLHVLSIIGATGDNDCPIKGIAPNAAFFTYSQSVASGIDYQVILDNADSLDGHSKNVSNFLLCTYLNCKYA